MLQNELSAKEKNITVLLEPTTSAAGAERRQPATFRRC